ncbi:hypothetical protein SHIRM173S_09844 [Streptomyces hirsutus]
MSNRSVRHMPILGAVVALAAGMLVALTPAPAHAAAGATLPFTSVEAEAATTTGSTVGPDHTQGTLASEASGRRAVRLNSGQRVEFTVPRAADAVNVAYSVPDGQSGSLDVYVNGAKLAKTLPVTSQYSYVDTGSRSPAPEPTTSSPTPACCSTGTSRPVTRSPSRPPASRSPSTWPTSNRPPHPPPDRPVRSPSPTGAPTPAAGATPHRRSGRPSPRPGAGWCGSRRASTGSPPPWAVSRTSPSRAPVTGTRSYAPHASSTSRAPRATSTSRTSPSSARSPSASTPSRTTSSTAPSARTPRSPACGSST